MYLLKPVSWVTTGFPAAKKHTQCPGSGRIGDKVFDDFVRTQVQSLAGTRQEKIHRAVVGKLNQIDALNNGDLWAANLPLTRHSAAELFNRYAS